MVWWSYTATRPCLANEPLIADLRFLKVELRNKGRAADRAHVFAHGVSRPPRLANPDGSNPCAAASATSATSATSNCAAAAATAVPATTRRASMSAPVSATTGSTTSTPASVSTIYTASAGNQGTLGGLVDVSRRFTQVLENALEGIGCVPALHGDNPIRENLPEPISLMISADRIDDRRSRRSQGSTDHDPATAADDRTGESVRGRVA